MAICWKRVDLLVLCFPLCRLNCLCSFPVWVVFRAACGIRLDVYNMRSMWVGEFRGLSWRVFQFKTRDICICLNTLQRIIHDLASALEETEQVDAVLLDFRKAFDEVSNQRFSIKLDHYGILGDILQWMQDTSFGWRTYRHTSTSHLRRSARDSFGSPVVLHLHVYQRLAIEKFLNYPPVCQRQPSVTQN